MIKILFFDIGYTLVDEDAVWRARCKEQAATEEARLLGLTAEDIFHEIEKASVERLPQYKTFVNKYGIKVVAPYRTELETLYSASHSVLKTLSEKYTLGIIANQSGGLQKRLADFNIAQYFTYVISSSDVNVSKPDVRIFEYALNAADCSPCEAVMIGDRPDNDIEPAKRVGMKTVWIKQGFGKNQTPLPQSEPDYVITELQELLTIF